MILLLTFIIFSSVFVQNLFGNPLKTIETKDSENFSKGIGEVIELSTENAMNIKDIPLKNNFNGNDFEKQFSSLFTEFVRTNDHYFSSVYVDTPLGSAQQSKNDLLNYLGEKFESSHMIYYNNLCYRTLTSLLDVSAGKAVQHCTSIMSSLPENIESITGNVKNFKDIHLKNNSNGGKKFSGLFTEFVLTNDFYFISVYVDTLVAFQHKGRNEDLVNRLQEKFRIGRIIYYNNLCYRTLTSLLDVGAEKAVHHCSSIVSSI